MKRLLAIAVVLVSSAAIATAPAGAAELITNGGFESGSLSPWTCSAASGSVVSSPVRTGTKALKGAPAGLDNAQCVQTVSVVSGTQYTLSAWVRGSYVFLGVTGGSSTWTPSATDWTQLSFTFTASGSSIQVYLHGWYGTGDYFADDVSLQGPGGTPVPGTPGTPVAGTVTDTSIALSWTASTGTVTGYRVYEGTTVVASPTGTSATISGLAACSTHTYAVRAFNSAGESGSAAVTGTTSGCATGTLPKHLLTGYWQNFVNGATPLKLASVPTTYDIIAVAFADADPNNPGGVTFTMDSGLSSALGGYTDAQLKADITTVHSRGQKVILSVGGQNGTVSISSASAATNFANSLHGLMTSFGFDGVDIDLENGVNATFMEQALRSLRSQAGSSLIITLAPQTIDMQSTGTAYFSLALNIRDILTIVHTQYYNSGSMLGCDNMFAYSQGTENFMTALACIQLQSVLRPDQIALGLPATSGAAGGGYVSPSVVNSALDCLAAGTSCGSFVPPSRWPTIRGAMTWSINWDASNGYAFANSVHGHLVGMP